MKSRLKGAITDIFRPETFGDFTKRVFWLKQGDRERSPQHWSVELWGEDCKELSRYDIGDEVEVDIEIRGRHWKKGDKENVFVSLKVVGMKKAGSPGVSPFKADPELPGIGGDDLPF